MEPNASFQSFTDAYLAAMVGQLRDHVRCVAAVRRLVGFFGKRSVAGIGKRDVGSYVVCRKQAGVCNRTINRELFVMSAAYRYAGRYWGWELPYPGRDLRQPEPEGRLRYLQVEEARRLVEASADGPGYLSDFIRLALHTGCRKGELLTLSWQSVDLKARRLTVESHRSKSGKRRVIPLNEKALEALRSREEYRATLALPEIRDLLGHSSIEQTERYAHLAPDRLRNAVDFLDTL